MSMIDGNCPKCGKRFGWQGSMIDRPPCPKCGHQIPRAELEADERKFQEIRDRAMNTTDTAPLELDGFQLKRLARSGAADELSRLWRQGP